jgi:hypothetical protein
LDYYLFNLLIAEFARGARSRLIIETLEARLKEPSTPLADHAERAAEFLCHCLVIETVGTRQHHPRAPRQCRLAACSMCE